MRILTRAGKWLTKADLGLRILENGHKMVKPFMQVRQSLKWSRTVCVSWNLSFVKMLL